MNRDWQNFKALHHNIEGAREGFEKACETLFRKLYPSEPVSQMAVNQGDGGIDIFVGKFSVEPIMVIQCKFFLDSFGDAQKAQIRDSFNRAKSSQKYKLKEWILVLPRVIDIEENSWWFNWIEKQDISIRLINGNELIDLMKEHNLYNQIFHMKDSLRLKEIHDVIVPKKNKISSLVNEKNFLHDIVISIQREEPLMLLSMTSTPYHNRIAKYYKEKIYEIAIENYGEKSVFSIHPPLKKDIDESTYFSRLGKQCAFEESISDSFEFIEALEQKLEFQDVFLLISDFEDGSDIHRKSLALEFRTLFSNCYPYKFYVVILGRKKLAKLKYEENEDGNSPLNYFYDYLIPIPTIDDYKQLEEIKEDISDIYNITGGHPELISFCFNNSVENHNELLLNSPYGAKFFQNYSHHRKRLLELFDEERFGWFAIWCNDSLHHKLFWDNLIVEDGNRFRWVAPIVAEMGKRYFR